MARVSIDLYTLGIEETQERIEGAIAEAQRTVELSADDASSHAVLAMALTAADRLTPALEEARLAARLDQDSVDAQLALATVLRLDRRNEEALDACHRAATIDPDSPRVLVALGDALREAERYTEAMEMYGQAIDLDHEAIVPQLAAAATLQKAGNTEMARRYYNVIHDGWHYAENRILLGAAALSVAEQDYEQALSTYGRIAIPENGRLPALLALYGKGYCLLRLGRDAEAEYFLSSLIDRVPQDYDGPARGRELLFRAYDDLADYLTRRGRDRKVKTLLRSACARTLAPTRLARRLAALLETKGENDETGDLLAKAVVGSDPLEDPLDLSETILAAARAGTSGGKRRLADGSAAARALRLGAERIAQCPFGIAHFRLARARSLARDTAGAIESLERARTLGYWPVNRLQQEDDFEPLRKEPAFEALLKP